LLPLGAWPIHEVRLHVIRNSGSRKSCPGYIHALPTRICLGRTQRFPILLRTGRTAPSLYCSLVLSNLLLVQASVGKGAHPTPPNRERCGSARHRCTRRGAHHACSFQQMFSASERGVSIQLFGLDTACQCTPLCLHLCGSTLRRGGDFVVKLPGRREPPRSSTPGRCQRIESAEDRLARPPSPVPPDERRRAGGEPRGHWAAAGLGAAGSVPVLQLAMPLSSALGGRFRRADPDSALQEMQRAPRAGVAKVREDAEEYRSSGQLHQWQWQ
jgi:hypothetical protein